MIKTAQNKGKRCYWELLTNQQDYFLKFNLNGFFSVAGVDNMTIRIKS